MWQKKSDEKTQKVSQNSLMSHRDRSNNQLITLSDQQTESMKINYKILPLQI